MTRRDRVRGSVLLIFLDGVGIGARDGRRNPFFATRPTFLFDILGGRFPSLLHRTIESADATCIPLDATLGVAGLPQSGTGQSALYTGHNTAKIIGQHFGPYLYSTLKPVVAEWNIFQQLLDNGLHQDSIALANAFPQRFFDYLAGPRPRMVAGMHAALSSGVRFRTIADLHRGDAVSTDITAARWKDIGHPDALVLSPYAAGEQLARIAAAHRFTLFEYFLTDKAGHERSHSYASAVLGDIDAFLRGVHDAADPDRITTLITSDHGNLEELTTKSHTRHPVPLIVFGRRRHDTLDRLTSISEITPWIIRLLRS